MFADSWLQRLFKKKAHTPVRKKTRRPDVEVLEDRRMPASIFVTGFADTTPGTGALTPAGAGKFNAASLRIAVERFDDLAGNSTIFLPTGTYEITNGEMDVNYDANTSSLKIINQTKTGISVIDGNDLSRIFVNNGGSMSAPRTLALERLELTHGFTDDFDGSGFSAAGGAIFNYGALSLNTTKFTSNMALGTTGGEGSDGDWAYGGAIYNVSGASLTIKNSTFDGNTAQGGGIPNDNSTTSFDNAGGAEGGAIFASGTSGPVSITASTFSNNQALGGDWDGYGGEGSAGDAFGGAIAVESDSFGGEGGVDLTIVNTTIVDNTARGGAGLGGEGSSGEGGGSGIGFDGSGYGGGISTFFNAFTELANDTIARNGAFGGEGFSASGLGIGGGISNFFFGAEGFFNYNVVNTIIAENEGDTGANDVSGAYNSLGHNFIGDADGSLGFTAAGDQTGSTAGTGVIDPIFDPLGLQANGAGANVPLTLGILAYSPCINAADNLVTVAGSTLLSTLGISKLDFDERGSKAFPRKAAGVVDIGAFELQINLNKLYKFKSQRTVSTTFSVPAHGPSLLVGSEMVFPPLPDGESYEVYPFSSLPTGLTTNSDGDGGFSYTVGPRFAGTVSFLFKVFVRRDLGEGDSELLETKFVFTATIIVTGPAGGRGAAGNFLGIGGFFAPPTNSEQP